MWKYHLSFSFQCPIQNVTKILIAIIHVNRLKRSHGSPEGNKTPATVVESGRAVGVTNPPKAPPERKVDWAKPKGEDIEAPPYASVIDEENPEAQDTEGEEVDLQLNRE